MADVETREQGQSDESSSSATLSPEAKAEKQKKAKEKVRRDQIFRKIFGHPALLLMFLQDYVKEDWVEGLTLGDFERQPLRLPLHLWQRPRVRCRFQDSFA